MERLKFVRGRFYKGKKTTFGKSSGGYIDTYNASYPELQRWVHNNVMYLTLHIVGSNNGYYDGVDQQCEESLDVIDPGCQKANAENMARTRASLEFLVQSFDFAKEYKVAGVMVTTHANIFRMGVSSLSGEEASDSASSLSIPSGYAVFWDVLIAEVTYFQKPVVLFHGDGHFYRVLHNPGNRAPNLVAVMCPGSSDIGWVLCEVDPNSADVFSFTHIDIPP